MRVPATESTRLSVGDFEVDLRCGELRRNGDRIKLQEKPFQILTALIERPGEVVTRQEMQQQLWPTDTFVDFEHSINTAVKKLREALGDDAENPRFIETLPRRGYRLSAPVEIVEKSGSSPEAAISPVPPREGNLQRRKPQKRWPVAAIAVLVTASVAIIYSSLWRRTIPSRSAWVQITHFPDSATSPALSPDGRMIAFIRGPETFVTPGELYVKILPDGQPMQLTHDDLPKMAPVFSPDGSRIAYTATDAKFGWNTWVVPVLGGEPQLLLPNAAGLTWADRQHVVFSEIKTGWHMGIATATEGRAGERDFGPKGDIYFLAHEGGHEFLYSMAPGEDAPRPMNPEPSEAFSRISPYGDWWLAGPDRKWVIARLTRGGPPIRVCSSCGAGWGSGGKFLYIRFRNIGEMGGGNTIVIGLPAGRELPELPPSGLKSAQDARGLNVVAEIDMTGKTVMAPGPDPSVYAYSRTTVQRNLFRIPLK
jgi:DNA-binding winged helix-turn-helix (wHTH) protein